MIRRFICMLVFITTVLTASFGQNILGRSDINTWAKKLSHEAPSRGKEALQKTDIFLAHLSPEAGMPGTQLCDADTPQG